MLFPPDDYDAMRCDAMQPHQTSQHGGQGQTGGSRPPPSVYVPAFRGFLSNRMFPVNCPAASQNDSVAYNGLS